MNALLQNTEAYVKLKDEIILTDMSNGFGIRQCWGGGGMRTNIDSRNLTTYFRVGSPTEFVGSGVIMQFDIPNITAELHGLLQL
jgi:hypothetical protein